MLSVSHSLWTSAHVVEHKANSNTHPGLILLELCFILMGWIRLYVSQISKFKPKKKTPIPNEGGVGF